MNFFSEVALVTWEMVVLGMVRTTSIMAAGLLSAASSYEGGCCSDMLGCFVVALLVLLLVGGV